MRRWFDVHLLGHAAFEYRYRGDHEVSVRVGFEVARWTSDRFWAVTGAPGASFEGEASRLAAVVTVGFGI